MSCLELSLVQCFIWWYFDGTVRCSTILAKKFRRMWLIASCLNISRTYKFANSSYEKLNFAIRFWPTWRNTAMLKSKVYSDHRLSLIGQDFFLRNFFCVMLSGENMFLMSLWVYINIGQAVNKICLTTVGIEPATCGILAQCSANWATRSGRFEYVIFRSSLGLSLRILTILTK